MASPRKLDAPAQVLLGRGPLDIVRIRRISNSNTSCIPPLGHFSVGTPIGGRDSHFVRTSVPSPRALQTVGDTQRRVCNGTGGER